MLIRDHGENPCEKQLITVVIEKHVKYQSIFHLKQEKNIQFGKSEKNRKLNKKRRDSFVFLKEKNRQLNCGRLKLKK